MSAGDFFLALYVMMSRATKLNDILIFDLPDRKVFESGLLELPKLALRMKQFETKAQECVLVAEDIMVRKLGWPPVSSFPQ